MWVARVAGTLHSVFGTAGRRRAALGHASTMPSPVECRNALSCPPRGHPPYSYDKQAAPFDSPVERNMTGQTIEMRQRVGLPAIFVAFFRLGGVSFGVVAAGWIYRE